MKRKRTVSLLTLAVGLGAIAVSDAKPNLSRLLPGTVRGWTAIAGDATYNRDTLFNYINGAAELYLSYGFQGLTSRTYSKAGHTDITVDIFDMGTPEDAFGVFAHSRETVDDSFGQGSQYTEGLLLFWKDSYYVSILASPETDESKAAVFDIARHIDEAVPGTGTLPAIISLLPREGLVEASVRYFHHHIWLNSHYFIADENLLRIDETTDAVLAKYGEPERRSILLLVRYENEEKAQAGYDDFVTHFLPERSRERVVRIEDQTWAGCRLDGRLVTVVLAAPSGEAASSLLEAVHGRPAAGD